VIAHAREAVEGRRHPQGRGCSLPDDRGLVVGESPGSGSALQDGAMEQVRIGRCGESRRTAPGLPPPPMTGQCGSGCLKRTREQKRSERPGRLLVPLASSRRARPVTGWFHARLGNRCCRGRGTRLLREFRCTSGGPCTCGAPGVYVVGTWALFRRSCGEVGPGRGVGLSTGPFLINNKPEPLPEPGMRLWHRTRLSTSPGGLRGGCPHPVAAQGVGMAAPR
jgi:hypothetical protein